MLYLIVWTISFENKSFLHVLVPKVAYAVGTYCTLWTNSDIQAVRQYGAAHKDENFYTKMYERKKRTTGQNRIMCIPTLRQLDVGRTKYRLHATTNCRFKSYYNR